MLKYVVLDFDGTVTQVDAALSERFLSEYKRLVLADVAVAGRDLNEAWQRTEAFVRRQSPVLAWRLGVWATAPAAPDPFILASTTAELMLEEHGLLIPAIQDRMYGFYSQAYETCVADFRPELADVLTALTRELDLTVCFVSNSDPAKIGQRLRDHLATHPGLFERLKIEGSANKFRVREPREHGKWLPVFQNLPIGDQVPGLARPVLLRRGLYFDALQRLWGSEGQPAQTLVCGDIFELDLAMPAWLGAHVHLIERPAPYPPYDYERAAMDELQARGVGSRSPDLRGMLARVRQLLQPAGH